jgi:hypothetical protein
MSTPPCQYVDPPDIPEGMTMGEYRRTRTRPARPGLLARLRRSKQSPRASWRRRSARRA